MKKFTRIAAGAWVVALALVCFPQGAQCQDGEADHPQEAEARERVWWPFMVRDLQLLSWRNQDQSITDQLCQGDLLKTLDDVQLTDNDHLIELLKGYHAGDKVTFTAERTIKADDPEAEPLKQIISAEVTLPGASQAYGTIMRGGRERFQTPEEIHPAWAKLEAHAWETLAREQLSAIDQEAEIERLADAFDYAMKCIPGHFRNDEIYYLLRRPFHSEIWGRTVGDAIAAEGLTSGGALRYALGLSRVHAESLPEVATPEVDAPEEGAGLIAWLGYLEAWLDQIDQAYGDALAPLGEHAMPVVARCLAFHPLNQDQNLAEVVLRARNIDWEAFDRALILSAQLADLLEPSGAITAALAGLDAASIDPEEMKDDLPEGFALGGAGADEHQGAFRVLIDFGGNDSYQLGQYFKDGESPQSTLVLDLAGDDAYSSKLAGLAAGVGSTGMLIDLAGNDSYSGANNCLGFASLGCGLLLDHAGNDRYMATENAQAAGFMGVGALIDRAGNDRYDAHTFSQGVGYLRGMGLLLDASGDDLYTCTGHRPSPYGDEGEYMGFGQGVGFGFRFGPPMGCGGIGALIDGGGRDVYAAGQFGLGIGYFFGMGFVNDRGGDDVYRAARYGLGTSAHYGVGMVLDDAGDDMYYAKSVAEMAGTWDVSVGVLVDSAGDDFYSARTYALGAAAQNAYGLFWDKSGNDTYIARGKNRALGYDGGWTYGAGRGARNLGIFLDSDGEDQYFVQARENNAAGVGEETSYAIWADREAVKEEESAEE